MSGQRRRVKAISRRLGHGSPHRCLREGAAVDRDGRRCSSKSVQCSPSTSLRRIPVKASSQRGAKRRCPAAALRKARSSSAVHETSSTLGIDRRRGAWAMRGRSLLLGHHDTTVTIQSASGPLRTDYPLDKLFSPARPISAVVARNGGATGTRASAPSYDPRQPRAHASGFGDQFRRADAV
jgi:hypothetical protein